MSPLQGRWRLFTNLDFYGILNTLPVRAKVINNHSPILLPLQGVGVYTLIPRALPWAKNWLPFQGARGEVAGDYPFQVGRSNPEKIKIGGSALAAEICAGPHNRLLRRQHCSSLCLQSEGHGHVAKMLKSAIGSPQSSSPSLCEQSELQCCAADLLRMFA